MARAVREAVGQDYELMFDVFNGWDLTYAAEMVRGLELIGPGWMEEPIPSDRVNEFRKLRTVVRVPIATGEHVYTRWQVKELLLRDAVDVIQTDPDWRGASRNSRRSVRWRWRSRSRWWPTVIRCSRLFTWPRPRLRRPSPEWSF